ncbi:hypothetical protein [Nocardioides ferulae]|uniref:hypothetical protein n=1 Tax=Nocardioides ferulae TaxID=2340821 RepID=UPI000EAC0020|nr:hypothetical protein [Nocardioides ferulae]
MSRPLDRLRGTGHLWGVGLAAFGLLAAGTWLQDLLPERGAPEDDRGARPHVRSAEVGETVDLRAVEVSVDAVAGARTRLEFGSELISPGVWIEVRYTATPVAETTQLGSVELVAADGRRWTTVGRNENLCTESSPGVAAHCAAYLEVPPDAVPGLRVRLAVSPLDQRYDAVAEVDLGLTGPDAEEFGTAEPLEAVAPWVGDGEAS